LKKFGLGLIVLLLVIVLGVFVSRFISSDKTDTVVGAAGGGKENFLRDEDVNRILKEKYNLTVISEPWSNGLLIKNPLKYTDGDEEKTYDFAFFSDERFYEYYKSPAKEGEAPRERATANGIALNTPIVIYSWDKVCDALINEGIVTENGGVYYISDMQKLLSYITEGKTWADIGLGEIYGKINITSPDPITSSPGTTYYGLLASIMNNGYVDEDQVSSLSAQLREFYKYSGFMSNTPADIFDQYLRTGMGAKPMIVDYEKSMVEFANLNPEGYNQVKDRIRILYPSPTIWNSHCITAFSELGQKYLDALSDPEIQQIAWKRYGFRTGLSGGNNLNDVLVNAIPESIDSVTQGLKKETYDGIIEILNNF
jgi:hypothetical protein